MAETPRLSVSECTHSGEKVNALTKSGVYVVCVDCGKRKKLPGRIVIEKVIVLETVDKTLMEERILHQGTE